MDVLLVLPPKTDEEASWALYRGDLKQAIASGALGKAGATHVVQISVSNRSSDQLLLLTGDMTGHVRRLMAAKVVVEDTWLVRGLAGAIGPILGAMMAILVFLAQGWLRARREKSALLIRIRAVINEILNSRSDADIERVVAPLPSWLVNPADANWPCLLGRSRLRAVISKLQDRIRDWQGHSISTQEFDAHLKGLRDSI
ncbi:MAG: hypothetical protein HY644_02525 [Acidobacteria bacterium]|nr:hypothetical protein [Acidobacteriota bacterium]